MRMRAITWSVRSGCKIITYLESQTPSFLLTVQLSSGYDDGLRSRLLSSTATVKRFQAEDI